MLVAGLEINSGDLFVWKRDKAEQKYVWFWDETLRKKLRTKSDVESITAHTVNDADS